MKIVLVSLKLYKIHLYIISPIETHQTT